MEPQVSQEAYRPSPGILTELGRGAGTELVLQSLEYGLCPCPTLHDPLQSHGLGVQQPLL